MAITLSEVETAIEEHAKYGHVVSSVNYKLQRASLSELRKLQELLEAQTTQGSTGSLFDRFLIGAKRRT